MIRGKHPAVTVLFLIATGLGLASCAADGAAYYGAEPATYTAYPYYEDGFFFGDDIHHFDRFHHFDQVHHFDHAGSGHFGTGHMGGGHFGGAHFGGGGHGR